MGKLYNGLRLSKMQDMSLVNDIAGVFREPGPSIVDHVSVPYAGHQSLAKTLGEASQHRVMLIRLVCCFALLGSASMGFAEEAAPSASSTPHAVTPTEFDSFIVVLLVRPPNAPEIAKAELDRLQEQHLANINRLADEGKLLKAGPFEDYSGRNVRGMFILKTDSVEQARAWVATDPLVKAGRLAPEYLK